jgi:hypothetical protein
MARQAAREQQDRERAAQEKLQTPAQERVQQWKAKQPKHGRGYDGPGLG